MSISMFFVSPQNPEEKGFNLPVCTEDVFRRVILPAAKKTGAQIVPLFEIGYELSKPDEPELESELQGIIQELQADSSEVALHAWPRLMKLSDEITRLFRHWPDAIVYIG